MERDIIKLLHKTFGMCYNKRNIYESKNNLHGYGRLFFIEWGIIMEMSQQETDTQKKVAMKVSRVSIIVNLLLSAGKLLAGIIANSGAMISDAIHSASDVFSTIIVMIGIHISSKKADKEHPYGHERLECVAAIVLAVVLFATGAGIGWSGIEKIISVTVVRSLFRECLPWLQRLYPLWLKNGCIGIQKSLRIRFIPVH